MLSSYTSPSEIPLVLEASDARWLSEEMSFLETQSKCIQLSVALQQALRRGFPRKDHGHPSDQPVTPAPAILYPAD